MTNDLEQKINEIVEELEEYRYYVDDFEAIEYYKRLIKIIKDQQAEINKLQERIAELEGKG